MWPWNGSGNSATRAVPLPSVPPPPAPPAILDRRRLVPLGAPAAKLGAAIYNNKQWQA
jgi:hypothetical protein